MRSVRPSFSSLVRSPSLLLLLCSVLGVPCAAAPLSAQEPSRPSTETEAASEAVPDAPTATFGERVNVEVVNVEVFVTDRDGNPVTDLTAEDFQVFENGLERPLTNFYSQVAGEARRRAVAPERPTDTPEDTVREGAPGPPGLIPVEAVPPPEQRLHLVIFVDNGHIRPTNRNRVFEQLSDFVHALEPSTLISVVSLGSSLRIHSDFLSSRNTIGEILDDLETTSTQEGSEEVQRRQILGEIFRGETFGRRNVGGAGAVTDPLLARIRAYAQSEYDRGRQSLDTLGNLVLTLGGVPGRRAMLWVADGIPQTPGEDLYTAWAEAFGFETTASADFERQVGRLDLTRQLEELVDRANSARVTLYTLDAAGDLVGRTRSASVGGRVPTEVLSVVEANYRDPQEYTAQATGGRRLVAGPRLTEGLEAMIGDFRTFYSLGFTPAEVGPETRSIEVRVRRDGARADGLRVRHRESYERRPVDRRAADATLAALLYGSGDNPLAVELIAGQRQKPAGSNQQASSGSSAVLLPVRVEVPVARVTLVPGTGPDGAVLHTGQLTLFVSIQGAEGDARPVQKIPFHAAIPADKLEEAQGRALSYTLPLVLQPGDRQVAVGVRDDVAGVVSTVRLVL